MTATTVSQTWTDQEFMAIPGDEPYELVNGALIEMGNSGMAHGKLGSFRGGCLSLCFGLSYGAARSAAATAGSA